MDEFIARIADDGRRQTVEEHLTNVAKMAHDFAKAFNAEEWGRLAGLWHDVGKFSLEFQKRVGNELDADAHIEQIKGKPDHSTAGAQHADKAVKQLGRLLAYAIAGHHAGLPNGKDDQRSCLSKRMKKDVLDWSACPGNILAQAPAIQFPFTPDLKGKRAGFQISFFTRMLYSCLVDGDFLDTEKFMNPEKASWRGGYPSLEVLNAKLTAHLEKLTAEAAPTDINKHRADILSDCLKAADRETGFFSLSVPTGGGKTLSSLAFALKHALKEGNDLKRIIYVIPYTSIIEQNAAVFREILGDDAVLEHHSTFDYKEETDEDRRSRLASENWDARLIVTTSVQFFESLFHNRSSKCRKLHNIAQSVVIIDEAQMLPVPFLRPCVEALRELVLTYNTSIVLCTATQPALSSETVKWRLENVREIIPEPEALYEAFKRVRADYIGKLSDDELSQKLSGHEQVLCVVNTRKHARLVYEKLCEEAGKENVYHLSALMCPAHRSEKLAEIREALDKEHPCRVVSTQLVEAGVDIDFPVVFRSAAGLDSIAQAAGRCNREGKIEEGGSVSIFMPEDGLPPGHFRQNAETADMVMPKYEDILSPDAIREYFETLYWRKTDSELDEKEILLDLWEGVVKGDFPFRNVAEKFHIIDEKGMESLVIPIDENADKLIQELRYSEYPGSVARKLQRFTIQIPKSVLFELEGPAVERIQKRFCVLINKSIYREELGLCPEDPAFMEFESCMW